MKRMIIAVGLLLVSPLSVATNWYILQVEAQRCEPARQFAVNNDTPEFATPLKMRDFARSFNPGYQGTQVVHLPHGMGVMAEIKLGNDRAFYYFSTYTGCQYAIQVSHQDGTMPNLNELR
ncbi:hypothetical protein [Acidithiobacillus thiooxidans]|uniref:hypothetical protein n=1 Tax=Acidithiobacillus thiooxidans TaxID=930 RepID=UPI001C0686DC|nr:hypothetical protein [Acidithiobacillus thiooxidans]MBU2843697.1 hypothetical protein [Acidithiobacillus thiooxidans]